MLDSLFRNMTPVVKNLLIINVLVFAVVAIAELKGLHLGDYLYLHHYSMESFQPYQYVTTMFFHTSLFHLFANMLGLVSFGVVLERFIGAKRFLMLYLISGLAGGLLYHGFHMLELWYWDVPVFANVDITSINGGMINYSVDKSLLENPHASEAINIMLSRALGASGAVFGVFAGVFRYFPNTEVMLLFPPIPLKIKTLFLVLMVGSLILSIFPFMMQGVAHMAHFGGGLAGLILVEIWQKDKTRFY